MAVRKRKKNVAGLQAQVNYIVFDKDYNWNKKIMNIINVNMQIYD